METSYSRGRAAWIAAWGLVHFLFPIAGGTATAQAPPRHWNGRVAVLVHGIYNSAQSMELIKWTLESRGWRVYSISIKPSDASITFEAMARQLDAFITANVPAGEKFDLIAFSMGGLVSRYYIQKMGGYERVHRFVTLSTPNHGTFWALLGGRAGVREMRPGSAMLHDLNGDASKLRAVNYTSMYTPFDLSIVPPNSSRLPAARNVEILIPMHPLMVVSRVAIGEILKALN
jgi:triacylglycerol lipase